MEFTDRAFDAWARAQGVKVDFIQPVQDRFVESFNRTFGDDSPEPTLVPVDPPMPSALFQAR